MFPFFGSRQCLTPLIIPALHVTFFSGSLWSPFFFSFLFIVSFSQSLLNTCTLSNYGLWPFLPGGELGQQYYSAHSFGFCLAYYQVGHAADIQRSGRTDEILPCCSGRRSLRLSGGPEFAGTPPFYVLSVVPLYLFCLCISFVPLDFKTCCRIALRLTHITRLLLPLSRFRMPNR